MKPQPHLAKLNTQYMRDDIHTDTDNMLKWNTWWGFSNEPVISARWTLHVNCAGSTALIEGLLLPRHLVSPASLPSHTRHTVYLQSHSGAHIDTHARARTHTHTLGNKFSPIWPGTGNPLGSDFADEQTVAGAANVLLPCWGILNGLQRETETRGGDKKPVEQRIRIGVDNKPIIPRQTRINQYYARERGILGDIWSGCTAVSSRAVRDNEAPTVLWCFPS